MDGQRSKVPILSDEEGAFLKRWVNNGGRLFAFVGHEAEKSPGYTKVCMPEYRVSKTHRNLKFNPPPPPHSRRSALATPSGRLQTLASTS